MLRKGLDQDFQLYPMIKIFVIFTYQSYVESIYV